MKLSTKILIVLGIIITLGALAIIVYQQYELKHQQIAIEEQVVQQKELANNIMRSQSQYATSKDIENFIKKNDLNVDDIKKDLDRLHASIGSVNQVVIKSTGETKNNLPSSNTGNTNPNPTIPTCKDGSECVSADPFGYQKKEQKLNLSENFNNKEVPIGAVGFSAWQDKPWSVNILPREYSITSVVGTDENQRQFFYNKVRIKIDGKYYDVQIAQAQTEQQVPGSKFYWWNPRLLMGLDAGIMLGSSLHSEIVPNIDLGIMSYGKFKNQPTFSILQLGLGFGMYSKHLEFVLTPFAYNIGNNLPLISNTYIGPSLMLTPNGEFSIMAGLRVGL